MTADSCVIRGAAIKVDNFDEEIQLLLSKNPQLNHYRLGTLLTAEALYKKTPADMDEFWEIYAYMDPMAVKQSSEGLIFLEIAKSKEPLSVIRHRLNNYVNIKFNDLEHWKSYSNNMIKFKRYCRLASEVVDDILSTSGLPKEITDVLRELPEVRTCDGFYEMLVRYRKTNNARIKYEFLRKLGLIVLLARIDRSVDVDELGEVMKNVRKAFNKGLGYTKSRRRTYHYWLDPQQKVVISRDIRKARSMYDSDCNKRNRQAMKTYALQRFECQPFRTPSGIEVLNVELRNKFKTKGKLSYTSFVEKMLRKNLEFPNQVRDVIGVKIVVYSDEEIKNIIRDLERFLGGSSTRKRQKNTYYKFGKRQLSPTSGRGYYVWKAVYDITLTNPIVARVKRTLSLTSANSAVHEELRKRLRYSLKKPLDFIVEVQLQDLKSHLLSKAKGSATEHALLKKNQVRTSTFYKLFPKQIYKKAIVDLKQRMLNNGA